MTTQKRAIISGDKYHFWMDDIRMKVSNRFAIAVFLLFFSTLEARAAQEWVYSVRPGDSLIEIAGAYLAKPGDWPKLQQLNQVPDPKHLAPGSRLKIPVSWLKNEAAVAEVVRVQGDVRKLTGDTTRTLTAGDKLAVGDAIATGTGGNLTLRFVDGSRLLVSQNSSLKLAQMRVYGRTGMAQTVVGLNSGNVETQVSQQHAPAAKYEIQTEALNLGVRGTDFRVGTGEAGMTHSEVLGGRVMAAGKGKPVGLDAGFGTLAIPGGAPLPPVRLLDAPDLSGVPARLERVPLRLSWKAVPGAGKYRAQIFADRSFDKLLLEGVFSAPSAKWADLPDGKYVLRVRGIDGHGLEGLNENHDFVLKARPEAPFIIGPVDGKAAYGGETVFRWAQVAGIANYRFQLSSSREFAATLFDVPAIAKAEHVLALAPGKYFWRVASITANGDQGPFSDAQGFDQRKIPESPSVAPPQMDDGQLTFRWKAEEAGQKFQIQLARGATFQTMVADTLVADPRFSLARPEAGTYFMRIKTIDGDGFAGPFGQTQQIEVPSTFPTWALILAVPLLLAL